MSYDIPSTTNHFQVEVEGSLTRKRFLGDFECKIMNQGERARADRFKASLNGGLAISLDATTLMFNEMVAFLQYSLTKYPDWWKESNNGQDLFDINVIKEVYDRVIEFENAWYKEIWGEEEPEEPSEEE